MTGWITMTAWSVASDPVTGILTTVASGGTQQYPIDIWGLLVAVLMACAAAAVSGFMRLGVGRSLLWSALRALLQLTAMGFILSAVIRAGSWVYVIALLIVMLLAAVQISLSRASGVPKGLMMPVFLTLTITMLLMVVLVPELMVRPEPWYAPQVVIPLTGMLMGNAVAAVALAMSRFFEDMRERRLEVQTMLALGATPFEAARTAIVSSVRLGLMPTIASLASTGVVTLPGMMTGQIIAGANPLDAAWYQFIISIAIAALTLMSGITILMLVYRRCFTARDQYIDPTAARTNALSPQQLQAGSLPNGSNHDR